MTTPESIFWVSLFVIVYIYALFPVVLFIFSRLSLFKNTVDESFTPAVSLLFAAYNEEAVIKEKIQNALSLDYPRDRLSIWVGSDCSSDRTDEICRTFGKDIHFVRFENRQGKSNVLNQLAKLAKSELYVFADANTMFAADAIKKLARHFVDPKIGGVCGRLDLQGETTALLGQWEKKYWRLESVLKDWEGRIGRVMGSNGAIYAIRSALYDPIPTKRLLMDDFFITLNVLRKGKKVIYDKEARATEQTSAKDSGEYTRKVRIARANFNFIWLLPKFFFTSDLIFLFLFFSHKVIRWFAPFFIITVLIMNIWLLKTCPVYLYILILQTIFYFLALIGLFLRKAGKIFSMPYYFISMNTALLIGFFKSLMPKQTISWKRVER